MTRQPALPVEDAVHQTFERFVTGPNVTCVAALQRCVEGSSTDWPYLSGPRGRGKTHLLRAACIRARQLGHDAQYVAGLQWRQADEEMRRNVGGAQLTAIDDLDAVAGDEAAEHALFHLFNRVRAAGRTLAMASRRPASELAIELPDLRSRLNWGAALHLDAVSDEDRREALRRRAEVMGYGLSPEVTNFLLRRGSRNLADLMETLETLERATLARQRRLTVPFVREILGSDPTP